MNWAWADSRFLTYVAAHTKEHERALFTPMQIARLCELAGVSTPNLESSGVNLVLKPAMARFLLEKAQARLEAAEDSPSPRILSLRKGK